VLPVVRQVVRELDPSLPFSSAATIDDLIAQALQMPRSLSLLVGGFAIVALVLSIVGIYGVMAYYVQQHSKEIGIRVALGGSPADVFRLIVGQGMQVVASGVVFGLLTALVLTRLMSSLLFGIGAADTFTFVAVTIVLLGVALAACCVPARRAVAVQPASVLRDE
jgi:putative ABC transport system permease protein